MTLKAIIARGFDYWWLIAIPVSVLAFAIAAWAFNPVEEGVDQAETIGRSLDIIDGKCPSGWAYNGPGADDHVAIAPRCINDPWVVHLYPNTLECNYGLNTGNPNAREVPCSSVPGWSR